MGCNRVFDRDFSGSTRRVTSGHDFSYFFFNLTRFQSRIDPSYPQYFPGCVIFICINFLFFLKKSNKYEDMVDWLMEVTIKVDISLLIGHIIKSMVNQNCSPSFKRQA
jgi:hypothetical protein